MQNPKKIAARSSFPTWKPSYGSSSSQGQALRITFARGEPAMVRVTLMSSQPWAYGGAHSDVKILGDLKDPKIGGYTGRLHPKFKDL